MSDDDQGEVPQPTIDDELERAEQLLADAKTAADVDISTATVVNRLYYACFHGAQAALYARGVTPRSHGAVLTLVGQVLVRPGHLPRESGRFLHDMETYRRRVDYGSGSIERDVSELIEETETFLEIMHELAGRSAEE